MSVKKGIEVRILETGLMDKPAFFCKQTLENYDRFMANTSLNNAVIEYSRSSLRPNQFGLSIYAKNRQIIKVISNNKTT